MSDEFEISQLREKINEILDPEYPNRDEILDEFAYHVYHSQKHTNALQEKFRRLYTGEKDKEQEFGVLFAAAMLVSIGTPVWKVQKRLNSLLDLAEEAEELALKHNSELPDMKLGGVVRNGLSVAIKSADLEDVWEQRQILGIENLSRKTFAKISAGVNVKVVSKGESFWCEVLEVLPDNLYLSRVNNELIYTDSHNLKLDDCIVVTYRHILEISW